MLIKDTELEYYEDDAICLDFYLAEHSETKEAWAKRVWVNCKLYKKNNGLDLEGNRLPSVYASDPKELWENKKRQRRVAFVKALTGEECDSSLLYPDTIRDDLKNNRECNWPESHNAERIAKLKNDPKNNYKTATQRYNEEEAKQSESLNNIESKRALDVKTLLTKFDNETISIIYPQGGKYLV
jgi:hypothetical protein